MATYTRKFVEPYPGQGYIDKPSTASAIVSQHLNNFVLTFKSLEDFAVANSLTPNPEIGQQETLTLTAIQIGNDIYRIVGGSGGSETLEDLDDVNITLPSNGQVLKYDAVNEKWVNANESGGSGDAVRIILTKSAYDLLPASKESDGILYFITDWKDTSIGDASNVSYNGTSSGLTATNLQDAIDELLGA